MAKAKVVCEWRGTPILTDGNLYYVPDGFGDFEFFRSEDEAIAHIEGADIEEEF